MSERARAYQEFVARAGQPPLLWQMAMLAQAGFTILPPVVDPNPDRCFPEMRVEMRDVEFGADDWCLVGGDGFAVMQVPARYPGHLIRPKRLRPQSYAADLRPVELVNAFEVEHFQRRDIAIGSRRECRWRSRILFCVGSPADGRVIEWISR